MKAIYWLHNIHQKVFAAVSQPDGFNMNSWHTCETTHCRAGWVIHLAGEQGRLFEDFYGTDLAALKIYRNSSPLFVPLMRFYEKHKEAMADMKRLAEEEFNLTKEK